MTPHR